MGWYATRSLFHFGTKENGINVYEERIVCFEAHDSIEANSKAALESKEYASANGFEVHDEQVTYEQDGDSLIDGYELWSELYESEKPLEEFYTEHYRRFLYDPTTD